MDVQLATTLHEGKVKQPPGCISQLSSHLASRLRSELKITCLGKAVEECVCNSIDAGAKQVTVTLTTNLDVVIEDDGCGVPLARMSEFGKRYCSQLADSSSNLESGDVDKHSLQTKTLSSVAEICILEITSRECGSLETMEVVLQSGTRVKFGRAATQRSISGTTLRIRDFMGRQPVRRTHMLARSKTEIGKVRVALFCVWLAHHQSCSLRLIDASRNEKLLCLPKPVRLLFSRLPVLFNDCPLTLVQLCMHYIQNSSPHGYSDHVFSKGPPPIPFQLEDTGARLSITGTISQPCRSPDQLREMQHIFVNRRHVQADQVRVLVVKLWKKVLNLYTTNTEHIDSCRKTQFMAGTETIPIPSFVLFIFAPSETYGISIDCDERVVVFYDWESVLSLVRSALISAFSTWAPDLLGPSADHYSCSDNVSIGGRKHLQIIYPAGSKMRDYFYKNGPSHALHCQRFPPHSLCESHRQSIRHNLPRPTKPLGIPESSQDQNLGQERPGRQLWDQASCSSQGVRKHANEQIISSRQAPFWGVKVLPTETSPCDVPFETASIKGNRRHSWPATDSSRKRQWLHMNPENSFTSTGLHKNSCLVKQQHTVGKKCKINQDKAPIRSDGVQTSKLCVEKSMKPSLSRQDHAVFSMYGQDNMAPDFRHHKLIHGHPSCSSSEWEIMRVGVGHLDVSELVPSLISRKAFFHGISVLGQCESKFIPAVCHQAGHMVLLLLDQHAADERVLLEELQAQVLTRRNETFSNVIPKCLVDPLLLDLSPIEAQALDLYLKQVELWGWRLQPAESDNDGVCNGKMILTHVPEVLGVQLNATELKIYLATLLDTAGAAGVPAGLQRLMVTKSCRGALMFGDRLSNEECQLLANRLIATEICFHCAHGRPTVVPLVDVTALTSLCKGAKYSPHQKLAVPGANRLSAVNVKAKLFAMQAC